MSKHKPSNSITNVLLRIGYGLVFACATIVLNWSLGYIVAGGLYALMGLAYAILYCLFLPALALLIANKPVSRALRVVALCWLPIVIFALLILAQGQVRDWMGAHCTGFFSAPTTCVSNQYLLLLIFLFNPYSILIWLTLTIAGLLKGWVDYSNEQPK